ncbi:alcohol dehydrogenase catalytic domain-containing protein [Aquitalea sp. LB_tupeE]|uniref:alcohol dehydrogenase catalytic domain-containing protein n=1 Tax=Aquitalea sp. LB_tupeE TaxID=2748078 RepID=UPI0015B7AF0A|nr:alcohol dehydrogenase catalytic domain-containing protein [Aquitalea sp. LB_tupeE]NWK80178.1 alcohol dehydrogenase catalytic domain-containing protein [Aquitalea sp. LB_tupeE]
MKSSYRAVQISAPGVLELIERPVQQAGEEEVLIDVEACGICGADAADIESPSAAPGRIPGHEVVGRIIARGSRVPEMWQTGQRVGVGRLGGHCQTCSACRRGQFHLCQAQPVMGNNRDGGYAEQMLVRHTGLVAIPDELSAVETAPLLCAGLATFNALKKSAAQAGDLVAIQGIGGLGHLAIQYARKMGFCVVAIGRGMDIAADALQLGAHVYIDSRTEDPLSRLQAMGGAQVILSTITDSPSAAALLPALAAQGRLLIVGVGMQPLEFMPRSMVGGERMVMGTLTGTPWEAEKTLDFSLLTDIRARIETMPLEQAAEAYQRMKSGRANFRMVLTMESDFAED